VNRVVLASVLLLSCASAQPDVAALIDQPTKESRAELAQAVATVLNGAPVTLADDALTRDSLLIIERAHTGRDLDKPEHFRLVRTDAHCVLVHERTGQRRTLVATTCRPR
jgi:hypothetical protein